jgi:hypothetical protein
MAASLIDSFHNGKPMVDIKFGVPFGVKGTHEIVFERKQLNIFELSGAPIWITDPETAKPVWGNTAACCLWGTADMSNLSVPRDAQVETFLRQTVESFISGDRRQFLHSILIVQTVSFKSYALAVRATLFPFNQTVQADIHVGPIRLKSKIGGIRFFLLHVGTVRKVSPGYVKCAQSSTKYFVYFLQNF